MASPLRFRYDPSRWSSRRVNAELFEPLDRKFGAVWETPEYVPEEWSVARFGMDNGDLALFVWNDEVAYWMGNTETPEVLWRTDKRGWEEVPEAVTDWTRGELLAELLDAAPWIEPYEELADFFLPVLMSKDGRHTAREFLSAHAAGFPDADRDAALSFYEELLATGALDPYRETMAGKLGTSERLDPVRMSAAMAEFTVAKLLVEAGYDPVPEVPVDDGYVLDFRADGTLLEVARPQPPAQRQAADTPAAAIRETAGTKADGQLSSNPEAVLVVDCSSFSDRDWERILDERPGLPHEPAVVLRARPEGQFEGYEVGSVPLDLPIAQVA